MRRLISLLVVWLLVPVPGALSGQSPRLVDVGGHRLEVSVAGTGKPVVILEAGLGQHRDHWLAIQDSLSTLTTVIAYSRAGYGASDPSPERRTPLQIVSELRALLRALGQDGPYVLVGHSLGGVYVRVFASRHPEEVVGLVLVDPTHERLDLEHSVLSPTYWPDVWAVLDDYATEVGGGTRGEMEEFWSISRRGTLPEAWPLPDVPIVIITAMTVDTSWAGGSEIGLRMRRRIHTELFEHMTRGVHIVTTESGHNVHDDQPGLLAQSIRWVVNAVR
jgi:pimeloyl-ACP methyl ester carboxylesterase